MPLHADVTFSNTRASPNRRPNGVKYVRGSSGDVGGVFNCGWPLELIAKPAT